MTLGKRCRATGATAIALLAVPGLTEAQEFPDTVVYLECSVQGGAISRGTGVLVSPEGFVLTAKHVVAGQSHDGSGSPVVPDGVECRGSIGVADPGDTKLMNVMPFNSDVDAALLQFATGNAYPFERYCPLNDAMLGKKVFVLAFRGSTDTGLRSYSDGAIATTRADASGVIETTAPTTKGMSGGPVFSFNREGIVGIVAGAEFESNGQPSYFGVLPASIFIDPRFNLQAAEGSCFPNRTTVSLTWRIGDEPVQLGVREGEGTCMIQKVFGQFNDVEDQVFVATESGEYVLTGEGGSDGGTHGASARCFLYE